MVGSNIKKIFSHDTALGETLVPDWMMRGLTPAKAVSRRTRSRRRRSPGFLADVIVVDGNPLEDLHLLFPRGVDEALDAQHEGRGGVEWTIKRAFRTTRA